MFMSRSPKGGGGGGKGISTSLLKCSTPGSPSPDFQQLIFSSPHPLRPVCLPKDTSKFERPKMDIKKPTLQVTYITCDVDQTYITCVVNRT